MKKELLIPVGNMETLYAAIHNGADAVYLAWKRFGARAYASNFDDEEIINAIKLCHLYKVKVYVTLNTMIYNNEVDEFINIVKLLYRNHVDALIMQDNGMISLVRKLFPSLDIHVSTQAHNHNYEGINYYKSIGCTRVVFDRESSLDNINNLNVDIEKEIFVYGALCVCFSGNCLFSALNGGRSANRGMCVGSCRLPYYLDVNGKKNDKKYYLSTKDLNTLDNLKDILDSNVDSLKIEGRMKSKEYVALITRIYRKLIDDYYKGLDLVISDEDRINILKTYNREFTKGYLFNESNIINNKTSNHQGISIGKVVGVNNKKITISLTSDLHQEDAIRFSNVNNGMYVNCLYDKNGLLQSEIKKNNICLIDNKDRIMYDDLIGSDVLKTVDFLLNNKLNSVNDKKIPIKMVFRAKIDNEMYLEVSDYTNNVNVSYGMVYKALKHSMSIDDIKSKLSKLGNTCYYLKEIDIDIDDNIFINIKDLNEIRRLCILKLDNIVLDKELDDIDIKIPSYNINKSNSFKYSILVRNEDQLRIALKNNIDYIYVCNKDLYNKYKTYSNIYLRLDRVNYEYEEYSNERLLCTELGSLVKYGKSNIVHVDYPFNIANDFNIDICKNLGSKINTLSIELDVDNVRNISDRENSEVILYSRAELMIIKNNIFNINNSDNVYLIDDKNNKYPVKLIGDYTYIYNCKAINNFGIKKYLNGFGVLRIDLFDENIIDVQKLIDEIKK